MNVLSVLCSITLSWRANLPQAARLRGGAIIPAAASQNHNKNLMLPQLYTAGNPVVLV